jgi:hypothetical protein
VTEPSAAPASPMMSGSTSDGSRALDCWQHLKKMIPMKGARDSNYPEKPRMTPHEKYWSYQAPETPATPPSGSPMSEKEWTQFSPGMRREIWRSHKKQNTPPTGKAG